MSSSPNRSIPFFDYPRLYLDHKAEIDSVLSDAMGRGAYIMQKDKSEFESSLCSFQSVLHSVGVANATDGMELLLKTQNLRAGDEVIISAHTMLATASAISMSGATPVPVDIGFDGLIDPSAVSNAVNDRTVGIMPTQLNGRICDMSPIQDIAVKYGLFIIEDGAQSLGATYKGQSTGSFGLGSSISFYPAKVLGCFGDGGGVVTNDVDIYNQVYQYHDHGRDQDGNVRCWGRNSRLDNIQAAILNLFLPRFPGIIQRRRQIASIYHSRLSNLEQVILPPCPDSDPLRFDVYQNYELQADNRDQLKEYLKQSGVGTLIQWNGKAIHHHDFQSWNVHLPFTDLFFTRCIMLPINMFTR